MTHAPGKYAQAHRWLLDLTPLPTAAGREHNVIRWIERWVAERPELHLKADVHGNLVIGFDASRDDASAGKGGRHRVRPLYFTAHMDHPAFVVERIVSPSVLELVFRGGVGDDYFKNAPVRWHGALPREVRERSVGPDARLRASDVMHDRESKSADAAPQALPPDGHAGRILEPFGAQEPFKRFLAEFEHPLAHAAVGDIVTWDLPHAEITPEMPGGVLHTPCCDDLAALVAALAAMDALCARRRSGEVVGDIRLLFTRAEEIGFVGAIGACRDGTIEPGSRLIALENSRASAEAPIGGGPIVRVGDRVSVFHPGLTDAVARRAEEFAGRPQPTASQKLTEGPAWKWQRKLMSGGACEASVFCAYGYEATCVCLPLGNYHNMADLDAVQAGTNTAPAHVAREYIAIADFDGMIDLLVACGERLPGSGVFRERLDRLWEGRRTVLE